MKEVQELFTLFKKEEFSKSSYIIKDGSKGSSFYIITKGSVKVLKIFNNKEKILAILSKNERFGELALIDDKVRSASVVTLENTEVLLLTHTDFKNMLMFYFNTTMKVLQYLTERVREGNEALISFMFNSASQRLIDKIIHFGIREDNIVIIKEKMALANSLILVIVI